MPLFESHLVPEDPQHEEFAEMGNRAYALLKARIVPEIEMEGTVSFVLRGYVRCYFQAHIRRTLMFIEGAVDACHRRRGLIALSNIRAVYETVASLCDFSVGFQELLDARDLDGLQTFAHTKCFLRGLRSLSA
jgi:hypothetical protein